MRILLLINWEIKYCDSIPADLQPSDYDCPDVPFWFFRYFSNNPKVDVVDISAPKTIKKIENRIRFHFYQTLRIISKINKYDLIFIHGSNSAMLLCALKRILHLKTPPILVVDISSFHQAHKHGIMHKLSQFSSKAFDYMVYHASSQIDYYRDQFPWLVDKSKFIPVGVDLAYWSNKHYKKVDSPESYFICVGYRKRDWKTLIEAYDHACVSEKLYLVGNPAIKVSNPNIKVLPFIPIDKLMNYIINAKSSIIPLDNFNYSFGQLTLLQQMAIGTPILAADVPAIHDYIQESKGILTYQPYNVDDLANKIVLLSHLSDLDLKQMGEENIAAINGTLSERNMAHQFELICNKICNLI